MTEYTPEDIDRIYDEYLAYKSLTEEKKKEFDNACRKLHEDGLTMLPSGRVIQKRVKNTEKVDTLMLSTLHPDVLKKVIDSGNFTISAKSLSDFRNEVDDCVETTQTEYFTLVNH